MLKILWLPLLVVSSEDPILDASIELVRAHRSADAALVAGNFEAAREGFLRCLELSPQNAAVAYGLACVESRDGRVESGLEWLARAGEWGYGDAAVARWDADLAALRAQPAFAEVLAFMDADRPEAEGPTPVAQILPPTALRPTACAIAPEGDLVVVGYEGGEVAELDAVTLRPRRRSLRFADGVWKVAWSPEGSCYAVLAHDGMMGIWKPGEERPVLLAPAFPRESKLQKYIEQWTGGESTVSAEDVRHALFMAEYEWPFGAFLQFDPTGERLLVAGADHGGSLWSRSGDRIHLWDQPLGSFFEVSFAWSPDGSRFALAAEGRVRFFDGRTGEVEELPLDMPSEAYCIVFDPRGERLATGHDDGRVRLWSLQGELLAEAGGHHPSDPFFAADDDRYVGNLRFDPSGRRLACTTGTGVYAIVFQVDPLEQVWISASRGGRMGEVVDLVWSPDAKRLWFGFASGVDVFTVVPAPGAEEARLGCRFVPSVSRDSALGVPLGVTLIEEAGIALLEAPDSHVRSIRVDLAGGGELLQTPAGHFTTDADTLDEWRIMFDPDEDPDELSDHAARLYDPKRVRAAAAGIRIRPVE